MMSDEARARAWDWAIASNYIAARHARECMDVGQRQAKRPSVSLADIERQVKSAINEVSDSERREYLLVALDSIQEAQHIDTRRLLA